MSDPENPNEIYVTSIVFEAEPEFGENEPEDEEISQYPLEDILDEYLVYVYDDYAEENASDKVNSYVEFASEDIEDIRNVLNILGKHVYNSQEGEYVMLKVVSLLSLHFLYQDFAKALCTFRYSLLPSFFL